MAGSIIPRIRYFHHKCHQCRLKYLGQHPQTHTHLHMNFNRLQQRYYRRNSPHSILHSSHHLQLDCRRSLMDMYMAQVLQFPRLNPRNWCICRSPAHLTQHSCHDMEDRFDQIVDSMQSDNQVDRYLLLVMVVYSNYFCKLYTRPQNYHNIHHNKYCMANMCCQRFLHSIQRYKLSLRMYPKESNHLHMKYKQSNLVHMSSMGYSTISIRVSTDDILQYMYLMCLGPNRSRKAIFM